jgi:lipopolysaccharide biosynthesis glycosyltransferase
MAMTAVAAALPDTAWQLFSGTDLGEVLRLAPAEYVRTAVRYDRDKAAEAVRGLCSGEYATDADAAAWLDIAGACFATGLDEESRLALDRAVDDRYQPDDEKLASRIRSDADWLRRWYGRGGAPARTSDAPAVAVLGFRSPQRTASSRNLGHYLESLATLSLLASRPDVEPSGDPQLVAVTEQLRARSGVPRADRATPVQLFEVDRDASSWAQVADGTWTFITGTLPRPLFGVRADFPFAARIRPIFLSVHVESAQSLTPAALDYLRDHAPIGCRDWSTVLLLQAADVRAFFAGAVTVALGAVARGAGSREGVLAVDVATGPAISQSADDVAERDLAGNLGAALQHLDRLAAASRVRTSRLQTYLGALAVGTEVRFRPENRAERRLYGLLDLDTAGVAAMRRGIGEKVAVVLEAVLAGKPDGEVYDIWRAACAADVERAQAFRADVPPMPRPAIDVAGACRTIHAASVTVERTAEAAGAEINVELSLDGNYKHQLEVVLDSIVTNTSRPVRAFVLCRDHGPADYERMAALFPEVSFVWLPTDKVDYGPISGLLGYTTVATMDRLLLPDLLPNVSRIVHHDLDALCLADLGELHDVDLKGTPLAGRKSPTQNHVSGFAAFLRRSERYRKQPERGHEFMLRSHTRHAFDFDILNAGIMTLDLDAMRADDFCRNFLPYVERFGLNDQAVLNMYAGANRVEVDAGWNWRPWLETVAEPKIAHWAGEFKPWKSFWVVGRDLWQAAEARVDARYRRAGLR